MADDKWIYLENVQVGVGKNESARWVQVALNEVVDAGIVADGVFGPVSKAAYVKWQKKLGYTGSDADGNPGLTSLTELGKKACPKFTVRKKDAPKPTDPPPAEGEGGVAAISPRNVTFTRYTGSGNVDSWIKAACVAAGVPANSAWVNGYKTLTTRESAGDPNACNDWDSNAKNPSGYSSVADYGNDGVFGPKYNGAFKPFQCSRGIAQCIPQTFAAYHAAGTSTSIYDPVANIAASIGYVRKVYGVNKDGSNLKSKVQQADSSRPPRGY